MRWILIISIQEQEKVGPAINVDGAPTLHNSKLQQTYLQTTFSTANNIIIMSTNLPSQLPKELKITASERPNFGWGGNKGSCRDAQNDGRSIPCIFDPATYYGDREADVAMTYLFGGFTGEFYDGYESEWPLPAGHENRRTVYNLYHILNHDVLFGGGYINQARGMIDKILKS